MRVKAGRAGVLDSWGGYSDKEGKLPEWHGSSIHTQADSFHMAVSLLVYTHLCIFFPNAGTPP